MSEKSHGDISDIMSESESVIMTHSIHENTVFDDSSTTRVDKRVRSDSEKEDIVDNEGFTTVKRKRKASTQNRVTTRPNSNMNEREVFYEVCITSKETLPKQIGLAKLLKSLNVPNILKVKYKNPYKVIIALATKKDAENLLNCPKLVELGYSAQPTYESNLSFGTVKNVEIEVKDEELQKMFGCESEVVAVKRLKRLTAEGKWEDSETVRLTFKSSTLPKYVFAYGCRFKVEKFTFLATQCSRCWLFGHTFRVCPSRKIVCPKCGEDHENCTTTSFKCVNCKGPHMSNDKSCSVFKKEKEIRSIMSDKGVTYRQALEHYSQKVKDSFQRGEKTQEVTAKSQPCAAQTTKTHTLSYRDILMNTTEKANKGYETVDSELQSEGGEGSSRLTTKRKKKKKKNQVIEEWWMESNDTESLSAREENVQDDKEMREQKKKGRIFFSFQRVLLKIKEIFLAEASMEEKFNLFMKIIWEEVSSMIVKLVRGGSFCQSVLKLFMNG